MTFGNFGRVACGKREMRELGLGETEARRCDLQVLGEKEERERAEEGKRGGRREGEKRELLERVDQGL